VQATICFGREATEVGSDGNDELEGTSGDDVIVGLGGDDSISGGDGRDLICGGAGKDFLYGGGGTTSSGATATVRPTRRTTREISPSPGGSVRTSSSAGEATTRSPAV
jgi:hypothetical protein